MSRDCEMRDSNSSKLFKTIYFELTSRYFRVPKHGSPNAEGLAYRVQLCWPWHSCLATIIETPAWQCVFQARFPFGGMTVGSFSRTAAGNRAYVYFFHIHTPPDECVHTMRSEYWWTLNRSLLTSFDVHKLGEDIPLKIQKCINWAWCFYNKNMPQIKETMCDTRLCLYLFP